MKEKWKASHRNLGNVLICQLFLCFAGCQFLPLGEYLRFVRVPENLRVGEKIITLEVLQKHNLTLESLEKVGSTRFIAREQFLHLNLFLIFREMTQNTLRFRKHPRKKLIFYWQEVWKILWIMTVLKIFLNFGLYAILLQEVIR